MKENSREEDIIKEFEKFCEDLYIFKDDDMGGHFEGVVGDQRANTMLGYLIFKEKLENKISDYKRVLKENEELKQEKIDNCRMIVLAQNELLGYMHGYEDGKKLKKSAIANIVENQQYYIIKKQMEKYEEHIEKLKKENEELKENLREENSPMRKTVR